MELSKSPSVLLSDVSSLIRAVTNGTVWPSLGSSGDFPPDELATISASQVQIVNDAFKEAFVSQLSYFDMLDLLEMTAEVVTETGTESIACTTLRLINQLAENNLNIQRQFIAAGLIQKFNRFTDPDAPREIKVEVAYLIGQVFSHAKELIAVYMGCRGFQIQLAFIRLFRQDCFADNLYLIMFAIDSVLVMFEELPSAKIAQS